MAFPDVLREAAVAEVRRRAQVTESLLRQAMMAGVSTLTLSWPDDFSPGSVRFQLPLRSRARRKALRTAGGETDG